MKNFKSAARLMRRGIPACLLFAALASPLTGLAQTELYPQHFPLEDVTLTDSPFKTAMDTNIDLLLDYDVDRLLTPFVRQAGLSSTTDETSKYYNWETLHPNFDNWGWNPSFALDGHVGGHYLTALSLAYAACRDESTRATLKERVDYMVDILKDCQDAFADNTEGLKGYIGGLPDNAIWTDLYAGSTTTFSDRSAWVPYYVLHKIFAGLRDAYVYAGNETAKTLFQGVCDWGIEVVSKFSEDDMDSAVLWNEHGGMNEVYADAYTLFGDEKYLTAAKKYSHKEMLNGMQTLDDTFLDYKHANTQVPKYIGFERIAQDDASLTSYKTAALNFWDDVAGNRTVCIGGNSVDEHFLSASNCSSYITNSDGPESCNTNNMLKLSENLFDDSHDAKYADFYEQAMLNHILSTQDPETGGYVYFTSLRPQSYRIYSTVNCAMWCCVGTGMENHSKYGHFIYTRSEANDTLFVNLFTASKLENENFAITQESAFPYGTSSTLTVGKGGKYAIAVRHPAWTTADYKITVNGTEVTSDAVAGTASYVTIDRTWASGDEIVVSYPMELTYTECPNYTDYVAFKYGPVLLAAQTTGSEESDSDYEDLYGEYAGDGRMDHAPECIATNMDLTSAPMILCSRDTLMNRLSVKDADNLLFEVDASRDGSDWTTLELKPFYSIHHARYIVYWNQQTEEDYASSDLAAEEAEAAALEARTLDKVATGEQQSEAGHNYSTSDSGKGVSSGEYYRDGGASGWFQYDMCLGGVTDSVSVMFRFNINDAGRVGIISVDGEKLRTVTIPSSRSDADPFYNVEYPIPSSMLFDADGNAKDSLTIRMAGAGSTYIPGVYYIRLLKGYDGPQHYTFVATDWVSGDTGRVSQDSFSYNEDANTISVTDDGTNDICLNMSSEALGSYSVEKDEQYLVVKGSDLSASEGGSYLWWLNGICWGTSVAPTYQVEASDGDIIIVWDVTQSGIDGNMQDDENTLSGNTIFGMTSTADDHTSVIKDICFYTADDAAATYSELEFLTSYDYDTSDDTQVALQGASGVTAHDAIKFKPNSFAFLEMATKTYSLSDYEGYEVNLTTPFSGIDESSSYCFSFNGWTTYDSDDARKYQFQNDDQNISGKLNASQKSGMDLALGSQGITDINNIWIQYGWGADDVIVELEDAYLVKADGTKDQLIYSPTHENVKFYSANYTATADGQYVCNISTLAVAGYDNLLLDFNEPVAAGWKVAFDDQVVDITEGVTTMTIPLNTDYSIISDLKIYTSGATYPAELAVAGMYLTTESGELADPNYSYFPLTNDGFDCRIWPTDVDSETGEWAGGYEPSFDETTQTFISGLYGFGGWYYSGGIDISDYTYLVVELQEQQSCGASFRIFDEDSYWSQPAMYDLGSNVVLAVKLAEMEKNVVEDGVTTGTTACDPSHVYYVGFWCNGGQELKIAAVYLTNDSSMEEYTTTSISSPDSISDMASSSGNDVYTVTGMRVRSGSTSTSGLPAGVYVVGGRKVVVTR